MNPENNQQSSNSHKSSPKLSRNKFFAADQDKVKKTHIGAKIAGLIALLVVGISVAYGAGAYFNALESVQQAYHGNGPTSKKISENKPISILLLGVDQGIEGRHDQGNSDTMILITINPQKKKATMTSIPRDLLVDVLGDGKNGGKYYMSRINSAYEVGGYRASSKTVSKVFNVPINYYMEVNMHALESMVDAVGGVDVNVPFTFTYHTHFKKGKMHLNGKEALDYARMRKDDPRGDYGRQMRQRQIINQIVKKSMSINSVSNYRKILRVISKYVETNLTFNDMMSIAMNYRGAASNIESGYVHGHDATIGGASMQVASTKELQRVSDLNRSNLDLPKKKLHNEETRQNRLQKGIDWKDPAEFTNYIIYAQHSDTEAWDGTN